MKKHELDTPVLVVDLAVLLRNIKQMQELARGFGVRLRPHTKTHKSPHVARLQVEAGAAGITVAKLGEAEVMAGAGFEDILIANQIVGRPKVDRLVALAQRARVAVLVDSRESVTELGRAFRDAQARLDVLIEVDTGKHRCGLSESEQVVELAAAVEDTGSLELRGVETHEGHVPGDVDGQKALRARAIAAGQRLVEIAELLRVRGHVIAEVSVGSTPAAPYTASVPGITEMRPGTYVFNDVNQMTLDQARLEDCALSVRATVVSQPTPGRAVLDAGSKSLFSEKARRAFAHPDYDGYGLIREAPGARITSLSEEHGVVEVPAGEGFPKIGGHVEIVPNHVCPAVNLHDELYVADGDDVIEIWPIAARGRVR